MRIKLMSHLAVVLFAGLFVVQAVPAQDFGQLLKAVDKLESSLSKLVAQEADQRASQFDQLQKQIKAINTSGPGGEDLVRLQEELAELKAQSRQWAEGGTSTVISESQLMEILNDIEFLKVENKYLRSLMNENSQQLASIDDEGFYISPETNPKVVELTDRLTELNASLEEMLSRESAGAEANPSVKHGRIALSAFVHEHFHSGPDETSSFISKRARLTIKGDINEYAQIKIQGEFAKSPKLLDGQVTISPHRQWSLSIGQYKPPFGTDFLISATSTPFVNRSMATGLSTNRDVGLSISYRNKFNSEYSLKLTGGLFNGSGINTSDVNNHKNFVARAEASLFGMFTVAPNLYVGKTNEIDSLKENLTDLGGSVTWKWQREIIEAEYIHSKRGDTKRRGWYVWGGHSLAVGLGFLQELQLLARYEQHDPDLGTADNRTDRLTVGTNLFIDKKYTKIQLNYLINTEEGVSVDNNEFLMNIQVAF